MTRNVKTIRFIAVFIFCGWLCACGLKSPLPVIDRPLACRTVQVAPGTEDFVLDTWTGPPRLLVSCHERRTEARYGGIYAMDINSCAVREMVRGGEPETLKAFKPHGMDIRRDGNKTLLYVILHDPWNQARRLENAIAVYEVFEYRLDLVKLLVDTRHLWSPNDLSVLPDGEIYATNDYRKGLDLLLKRSVSEVVRYDPVRNRWAVAAGKLAMANGILARRDRVYVTTTLGGQLLEFPRTPEGMLEKGNPIAEIKGLDNIMADGDALYLTAHFDDLAFLRHRKKPENISPTVVFRFTPKGREEDRIKAVYADDGRVFSAASTAMAWQGKLYMGQVFDRFIQVCEYE